MRLKLLEKIRSKGIMPTESIIEDYYDELTERKNEAWYLFSRFVDDSEKENFRKIIEKAINGDVKAYQKLCEIIKIALDKISKLDIRKDGLNVVMTYDSTHEQYLDVDKFIMNTKSEFDTHYGYTKKGFEKVLNNEEYLAPTLSTTEGINEEFLRYGKWIEGDRRWIEADLIPIHRLLYKMSQFRADVWIEIKCLKEDIPRFKKNIESDPSLFSFMKPEYIDRLCHFLCKESKIAKDVLYMDDRKKIVEHNNLITKLYDILNNKFESRCWDINNEITFVNSKSKTPIEDKYLTSKDSNKVLRRAILRLVYLKGGYEKLNELSDYMYQETESLIKYVLATYKEKAYHKNKSIDTLFAYYNFIHFFQRLTFEYPKQFSEECKMLVSDLRFDYLKYYNLDQHDTEWALFKNSPYYRPDSPNFATDKEREQAKWR